MIAAGCVPPSMAVGFPRNEALFIFLRALSSPWGQRWQCPQFAPLEQPWGFQNQAHGLHSPVPCFAEPGDGRGWPGVTVVCSGGCGAGVAAGTAAAAPAGTPAGAPAAAGPGSSRSGEPALDAESTPGASVWEAGSADV